MTGVRVTKAVPVLVVCAPPADAPPTSGIPVGAPIQRDRARRAPRARRTCRRSRRARAPAASLLPAGMRETLAPLADRSWKFLSCSTVLPAGARIEEVTRHGVRRRV